MYIACFWYSNCNDKNGLSLQTYIDFKCFCEHKCIAYSTCTYTNVSERMDAFSK